MKQKIYIASVFFIALSLRFGERIRSNHDLFPWATSSDRFIDIVFHPFFKIFPIFAILFAGLAWLLWDDSAVGRRAYCIALVLGVLSSAASIAGWIIDFRLSFF